MRKLPRYRGCFVCGRENPCGLGTSFTFDGERVVARFSPKEHHVGYPGITHGGVLAAVLDEAMGWAVGASRGIYFLTVELRMRYIRPVRPGQELVVEARALDKEGRYYAAEGKVMDPDGRVYVKGWGRYARMPREMEEAWRAQMEE